MMTERWYVTCDGDHCGATFGRLDDYRTEAEAAGACLRAGWHRIARVKMSGRYIEMLCPTCAAASGVSPPRKGV